jgi:hypothetical protein
LASEKGALFWKGGAILVKGSLLVVTGKASDAVRTITSGLREYRAPGATIWMPTYLSYLAWRTPILPGSAHGVRKIAATRAAQNGATVAELEAIFGWHGGGMASHYTREADRVRLAKEAMHKLANEKRTSIPAPFAQVRAAAPKGQSKQ